MENSFKAVIYKSEVDFIARCIADYPDIETGGDLFGFWTYSGYPVIQYAIGPGDHANHSVAFFQQDERYLYEMGVRLNQRHGLQHIGEWHSHHRLGLAQPSGHDSNTVMRAIRDNDLGKFFLVIGNFQHEQVSLNGFMYFQEQRDSPASYGRHRNSGESRYFQRNADRYTQIKWVVLESISPIRQETEWQLRDIIRTPKSRRAPQVHLDRTTLSETAIKKPNFAQGSWLSTAEGQTELKEIHAALANNFDQVRMFKEDDKLRIQFDFERRRYHILFPGDYEYPHRAPEVFYQSGATTRCLTEAKTTKFKNIYDYLSYYIYQ